ncbi:staphyloferrin B biosynthesis decarboxylase SbnH [Staphylococcus lentus]|uniref:staphyloferrin B biosynthesis decarboxylase SbnH n=1 Tax=Mammaliicoccus lentus TaxID=42858 RepID=UPI001883655C|nr:staphyloferrin B biosynthesis decarboxylase SbnH [Mammaliicoccus lentus]MBF0840649.1 staphyloferrin B biosynthesis decarboxylase SbnH [Mammaliicoccus lentus]
MCVVQPVIEQLKLQHQPVCHYIYDLIELEKHLKHITSSLPDNCQMYYAMKANSEREILDTISQCVEGFEVASQGEMTKGLDFKPANHIIFGGPGKTDEELRYAVNEHVQRIHVESLYELQRLNVILKEEQKTQHILLRVNLAGPFPNATLHMAGRPTQFGISENEVDEVIKETLAMPSIQLDGFHFHSISNNLDAELHLNVIKLYFNKAKAWSKKHHFPLKHINIGGGIGVNYADLTKQFEWNTFVQSFNQLIIDHQMEDVTLNLECGRFIMAHIGYYVTEVLDVKKVHNAWYAILRGGTQQFRLPVSWQHNHPFEIYQHPENPYPFKKISISQQDITLVGQLCTPKDVFAKDVHIDHLSTGDVIIFKYAGAYGWSISHHDFLSHPHPEFIYLKQTKEDE